MRIYLCYWPDRSVVLDEWGSADEAELVEMTTSGAVDIQPSGMCELSSSVIVETDKKYPGFAYGEQVQAQLAIHAAMQESEEAAELAQ